MVLRAECEESPEEKARLLAGAIDSFSKQVAYFPSRKKAYLQLARALAAAGETREAAEHLRRARARWPDDPRFNVALEGEQSEARR